MNSKTLVITSLWGISIASAFIAGRAISSPDEDANAAQATKSPPSSSASNSSQSASAGSSTASLSSAGARLNAAPMIVKGSSPEQMIEDIARSKDAIERNNALLALIDSLSPEQFPSVIASFRQLGITRERWGEYEILLTAWAKVSPNAALEYASENTRGGFARNTILSTWASTNPDAAIAWAEANHEDKDAANPWLVGVIEGIAPYDIPRATELMETLPRSDERGQALRSMVSQLMATNPEDAKDWTASIEEDHLRAGAYAYTAEVIAQKDPADAAQWLSDLGDVDALNRAGEDSTGDWYRENPEEATAWVTSLPPEAMSEAAEGIIGNVVREDPVQAAEYLSQLANANPDANFDSSIRELVRGSARQDPELAAIWIAGLSDTNDQSRYYRQVLGQWQRQDSEAARAWINTNEANLPSSVTRRFLGAPQQ